MKFPKQLTLSLLAIGATAASASAQVEYNGVNYETLTAANAAAVEANATEATFILTGDVSETALTISSVNLTIKSKDGENHKIIRNTPNKFLIQVGKNATATALNIENVTFSDTIDVKRAVISITRGNLAISLKDLTFSDISTEYDNESAINITSMQSLALDNVKFDDFTDGTKTHGDVRLVNSRTTVSGDCHFVANMASDGAALNVSNLAETAKIGLYMYTLPEGTTQYENVVRDTAVNPSSNFNIISPEGYTFEADPKIANQWDIIKKVSGAVVDPINNVAYENLDEALAATSAAGSYTLIVSEDQTLTKPYVCKNNMTIESADANSPVTINFTADALKNGEKTTFLMNSGANSNLKLKNLIFNGQLEGTTAQVIFAPSRNSNLVLDGVTIKNIHSTQSAGIIANVRDVEEANLSLNNVKFVDCTAPVDVCFRSKVGGNTTNVISGDNKMSILVNPGVTFTARNLTNVDPMDLTITPDYGTVYLTDIDNAEIAHHFTLKGKNLKENDYLYYNQQTREMSLWPEMVAKADEADVHVKAIISGVEGVEIWTYNTEVQTAALDEASIDYSQFTKGAEDGQDYIIDTNGLSNDTKIYTIFVKTGSTDVSNLHSKPLEFNVRDIITGVESIESDNNANAIYYNLQGLEINPENAPAGVYIKKQGNTISKVLIR